MEPHDDFSKSLAVLRTLAQQDFAAWWASTSNVTTNLREDMLFDAFHSIQGKYGEVAAAQAVDYLILRLSLDDDLKGLPFPEMASPATYKQAKGSFDWAMRTYRNEGTDQAFADGKRLLEGIMDRLVTQPARDTVAEAVIKAGTGYARVPEPGACSWCMMLAANSDIYSKESVQKANGYHDRCRCVGIEVKDDTQLPRINRDLRDFWKQSAKRNGGSLSNKEFQEALIQRRNGTPPWVPLSVKRVHERPQKKRYVPESRQSHRELKELRLLDTPSAQPDYLRRGMAKDIWDKEETVREWLLHNGDASKVERVGTGKEIGVNELKTPDFLVNDEFTVDVKTINVRQIKNRVSDASQQAAHAVLDLRGQKSSEREAILNLKNAVRAHGHKLESITVITDGGSLFWEVS